LRKELNKHIHRTTTLSHHHTHLKASKNVIKGYTVTANSFINVHDYNTEAVQGNEVKLL
jgi:hypothetical protein